MIIKEEKIELKILQNQVVIDIRPLLVGGNFGDMWKSQYDVNTDGIVDKSELVAKYYIAGEQINSLKVVYADNGRIYKADSTNWDSIEKIVGITLQAGDVNDSVLVCRQGEVQNPNWGLVPGAKYYLGLDGDISTNPTGHICQIGFASDSETLVLEKSLTIQRS